ncbi:sigma factor-like helix-turn-helix DNA-binding protein [Kribbella jiaozuonensis]|uniref:RNA polymerase sigma factor 70 region 4 type 2 domain-containing protein n=1 Tax=Kribbella jiaozuonensis TaxID=2575441 RepID=A0A4U3LZ60_9ACTN|nr:sigma factor-like helix-turn-helix DNA-binding protein [Kribbella jiaozuonensis]TKK80127.1 hypothetical protein FDA38_17480 [Kribbella jiaozuonensis]
MAVDDINHLDELVRLEVLRLRRTTANQAETIIELSDAGFSAGRIAELLGTTPATVRNALVRAKKNRGGD